MKKILLLTAIVLVLGFIAYDKLTIQTVRKLPALDPAIVVDKIKIEKAARKMSLLQNNKVVREYVIDLGGNPIGHKEREGDEKTPEGIYKISGRNPHSKYHLSLRISYPDEQDIRHAQKLGVSPGGDIMIHGLPNVLTVWGIRKKLKKDWTRGCVAVQTNEEMEEIWALVKNGTLVEIVS